MAPVWLSMTLTVPSVLLPANTNFPSGVTAIPSTRGATGIARTRVLLTRSISETPPEPTFEVHTRLPSAVSAAMCEPCAPVPIAPSTVPDAMFTSDHVLRRLGGDDDAGLVAREEEHAVGAGVLAQRDGAGDRAGRDVDDRELVPGGLLSIYGDHAGAPAGRDLRLVRPDAHRDHLHGVGAEVDERRGGVLLVGDQEVAGLEALGLDRFGWWMSRSRARRGSAGVGRNVWSLRQDERGRSQVSSRAEGEGSCIESCVRADHRSVRMTSVQGPSPSARDDPLRRYAVISVRRASHLHPVHVRVPAAPVTREVEPLPIGRHRRTVLVLRGIDRRRKSAGAPTMRRS